MGGTQRRGTTSGQPSSHKNWAKECGSVNKIQKEPCSNEYRTGHFAFDSSNQRSRLGEYTMQYNTIGKTMLLQVHKSCHQILTRLGPCNQFIQNWRLHVHRELKSASAWTHQAHTPTALLTQARISLESCWHSVDAVQESCKNIHKYYCNLTRYEANRPAADIWGFRWLFGEMDNR